MRCPIQSGEWDELYVGYVARTLPVQTRASLDFHLAECEECRALAAAQSSVWAALDSWEPAEISPHFDAALFERIAFEESHPWYSKWLQGWSFRPAMPLMAACAALILALLLHTPAAEPKPDGAKVQQSHVDIEQVERALDDIDMLKQVGVVPAQREVAAGSESL